MSSPQKELRAWTTRDSAELYQLSAWGGESFTINDRGDLVVQPMGKSGPKFSLPELIEDLRSRGLELPILLRISNILQLRVAALASAFKKAIEECGYIPRQRNVFYEYIDDYGPTAASRKSGGNGRIGLPVLNSLN